MLTLGGHYGRVKGGYNGNGGYNGPKAGDNMVMGDTMVGADTMVHDIRNTIISSSQHSIESPTLLNPPLKCKNMGVLLRM